MEQLKYQTWNFVIVFVGKFIIKLEVSILKPFC